MQVVIGLTGSKSAGKDTVGNIALKKFKARAKVAFADSFKNQIMKNVLGFSERNVNDPEGKEEKLDRDIFLTHRVLRRIKHTVADVYNYAAHENVINPYTIAVSTWEGHKFVKDKDTYRDVMRFVSTEIIRSICPTWHIDVALKSVPPEGVTFITDLRFDNELEVCKSRFKNFFLVYVKNEAAEERNEDTHPSELGYKVIRDKAFATINSVYGELDDLEKEAAKVFKKIQKAVLAKKDKS